MRGSRDFMLRASGGPSPDRGRTVHPDFPEKSIRIFPFFQ